MTTRTPEELEEKLHYHFKNKELLITALTHSSYANESKTPTLYNERLEFLGDSVLSVVVANYLFHHSTRPEGELSRMRASLVSEDALFCGRCGSPLSRLASSGREAVPFSAFH